MKINNRRIRIARRLMLVMATLPLIQAGACLPQFIATSFAQGSALQVSTLLGTSLETILFNAFGL